MRRRSDKRLVAPRHFQRCRARRRAMSMFQHVNAVPAARVFSRVSQRFLAYLVFAEVVLASCSGSHTTPTETPRPEPGLPDVTGSWTGDLGDSGGEDWAHATVTLYQDAFRLTGQLITGDGTTHPLTGSLQKASASVDIGGLVTGASPCYLSLGFWFERDRSGAVVALPGVLTGRCPNTFALSFRLVRASATSP
jgi:hypothetical protein